MGIKKKHICNHPVRSGFYWKPCSEKARWLVYIEKETLEDKPLRHIGGYWLRRCDTHVRKAPNVYLNMKLFRGRQEYR